MTCPLALSRLTDHFNTHLQRCRLHSTWLTVVPVSSSRQTPAALGAARSNAERLRLVQPSTSEHTKRSGPPKRVTALARADFKKNQWAKKPTMAPKRASSAGGGKDEEVGKGYTYKGSVRSGHGSTEVVLEENDARFRLSFRRAAEGSRLLVDLQSRDASEVWAMPFAVTGHEHKSGTQHWTSGLATGGSWHCLARREAGLTYSADYTHFDGGQYVLITNERGAAEEGALRILSEADALADAGRTGWSPNTAVADGEAGVRTLLEAQCFSDFAAIEGRVDGASVVLVWCYASGQVLLSL